MQCPKLKSEAVLELKQGSIFRDYSTENLNEAYKKTQFYYFQLVNDGNIPW